MPRPAHGDQDIARGGPKPRWTGAPLRALAIGCALLGGAGPWRPPCAGAGTAAGPADIVEAEHAFCRAAVARGTRAGFLEYLAEEAVIFRPGPVNGRQWYLRQTPSPGVLKWEPEHFEVAPGGDLGYTTGPWEFWPDSLSREPSAYGHYVSIWHRTPQGAWKVVMDFGVSHPKPEQAAAVAPPGSAAPRTARDKRSRGAKGGHDEAEAESEARPGVAFGRGGQAILAGAERAYARDCAQHGRTSSFRAVADSAVRVLRAGAPPIVGRELANALLPDTLKLASWESIGSAVSRDGVIGFTYGVGRFAPRVWTDSTSADSATYARIWRRAQNRAWKVILDYAVPLRRPRSG
jgi:ketosteroid isomerase-like protein